MFKNIARTIPPYKFSGMQCPISQMKVEKKEINLPY
jgi:hypothetical protein